MNLELKYNIYYYNLDLEFFKIILCDEKYSTSNNFEKKQIFRYTKTIRKEK